MLLGPTWPGDPGPKECPPTPAHERHPIEVKAVKNSLQCCFIALKTKIVISFLLFTV